MTGKLDLRVVDLGVFIIANLANLWLVGIFVARLEGLSQVEHLLGLVMVCLFLPVFLAVVLNAPAKREWWTVVLPSLLNPFLAIELLFDYVLKLNSLPATWHSYAKTGRE